MSGSYRKHCSIGSTWIVVLMVALALAACGNNTAADSTVTPEAAADLEESADELVEAETAVAEAETEVVLAEVEQETEIAQAQAQAETEIAEAETEAASDIVAARTEVAEAEATADIAAENVGEAAERVEAVVTGELQPVAIEVATNQTLGGGLRDGEFQPLAATIAATVRDAYPNLSLAVEETDGSLANLLAVDSGDLQYGLVYAGDVTLGAQGRLNEDTNTYTNAQPVAALFDSVAQLVVAADSEIETLADLAGKRIALGQPGSGSAVAAERYFTALGLLDQMEVEYISAAEAAQGLGSGQIDGFWTLDTLPSQAIEAAAEQVNVRLLDLATTGEEDGFFQEYPFYQDRGIDGNTYLGNSDDIASFGDTMLLVANSEVSADLVYNALIALFSDDGLAELQTTSPAARDLSREGGVESIPVPLHPGAYRYWDGVGVVVPEELRP